MVDPVFLRARRGSVASRLVGRAGPGWIGWALALAAGAWLVAAAGQARAAGAEVARPDDAAANLQALASDDLRGARGAGLDAASPAGPLTGENVAVILWDDYEKARRGNGGSISFGANVNVNSSVNR